LTTELPRENGSAPEPARASNGENSTKAAAVAANAKESVGIPARWVPLIVHRLFDLVRNDEQFNFSTSKPGMLSALLLLGGVVVVLFVAIRFPDKLLGGPEASPVRRRGEQVRLTSGAEIESMYGLRSQGAQRPAQPMSPGLLMRLRGRVVLMAASGEEPQPKAKKAAGPSGASVGGAKSEATPVLKSRPKAAATFKAKTPELAAKLALWMWDQGG